MSRKRFCLKSGLLFISTHIRVSQIALKPKVIKLLSYWVLLYLIKGRFLSLTGHVGLPNNCAKQTLGTKRISKKILPISLGSYTKAFSERLLQQVYLSYFLFLYYRVLVTTENLFSILQTVRPSNLHVLCQTESLAPTGCIPRLNFKPSTRVPQITLRILPKSQIPLNLFSNNYYDHEYEDYAVDPHSHRTVSRRLVFSSPAPANRKIRANDCSLLDISGVGRLEDDSDKSCNGETISENLPNRCWFQIQSSLTGFLETFIMNSQYFVQFTGEEFFFGHVDTLLLSYQMLR